jgi:hypothetical protein
MATPVVGYAIAVALNQQVNPPARISLQFQPGGPYQPVTLANPSEFVAIAALLAAPGRLFYDQATSLLEKIEP